MIIYRSKHMKDRLLLLYADTTSTPYGGLAISWREGPQIWGRVEPLTGSDGYSPLDPGGGMTAGQGVVRSLPAARYRIIVSQEHELDHVKRLIWYGHLEDHLLEMTRRPTRIQNQTFQSITTVEVPHDHS